MIDVDFVHLNRAFNHQAGRTLLDMAVDRVRMLCGEPFVN